MPYGIIQLQLSAKCGKMQEPAETIVFLLNKTNKAADGMFVEVSGPVQEEQVLNGLYKPEAAPVNTCCWEWPPLPPPIPYK